jgi:hypothetical protein
MGGCFRPLPVRLENDKHGDPFGNAAVAFSASRWETAGAVVRFPVPCGGTAPLHSKDPTRHITSFWTRLFHAASRRDKREVIEGAKLMNILETRRRELVAGPLVALAAMALGVKLGKAAGVDPTMTIVTKPDAIPWKPLYNFPPGMAESANMFGDIHAPGQYFVLIRWHPGYMSAPRHTMCRTRPRRAGRSRTNAARTSLLTPLFPCPPAHSSTGLRRPLIMMGSKRAGQSRRSSPSRALGRSRTT